MKWLFEGPEADAIRKTAVPPLDSDAGFWLPKPLAATRAVVVGKLTYAVLDERDEPEGMLSFVLSRWPRVDALGRVRHSSSEVKEVAVPGTKWMKLLTERRLPEVLRERPPRIGDVFALLLTRRDTRGLLAPVGPVVDVTADAREAARAAFYGAVAAPLDAEAADAHAQHEDDLVTPLPEPAEWFTHVARTGARRVVRS